jgi:DtxR family transcriptional regulator, Mn-dependent transcriptional regulator
LYKLKLREDLHVAQRDTALSASLEDYLETIFHIEKKKHAARAKDITERLQVSGASVTAALRTLGEKKLINYAPYDLITLTTRGRAIAENIVQRHAALKEFFVHVLGIDNREAEEVACKMEHSMSENVFERLTQFIAFLETCPREGADWLKGFSYSCEPNNKHLRDEDCLAESAEKLRRQWVTHP